MDNRTIIQQSLDHIEENLQTDLTAAGAEYVARTGKSTPLYILPTGAAH